MGKIGLSIYALHVSGKNAKDLKLHNIRGNESLLNIIEKFIDKNSDSYKKDEKEENVFKCDGKYIEKVEDEDKKEIFTYICGRVKTGEYGVESEIVNSETGEVTHVIKPTEASVLPFDFCIAIPGKGLDNTTIGLAILQTNGGFGIKKALENRIKTFIQNMDPSMFFYMGNLCPISYINRFLSDQYLKKIRLIRYNIPEDDANRIGINNGVSTTYEELTICRPTGFIARKKAKINEYLAGKIAYTSIIELPNFEYEDLKFEFKMGNSMKTMSMKNLKQIAVTEDINDRVELNNGNPTRESMINVFKEVSKEYLQEIGLIEKIE